VAASAASKPGVAGEKGRSRFLLQLSSFQDRAEADTFARRFSAQSAYVVSTEIPGKGTWYRVRVGSYGNLQEASAAKATFEREHNVIAYVAGSGPSK
jgi:cell division protein FtsN